MKIRLGNNILPLYSPNEPAGGDPAANADPGLGDPVELLDDPISPKPTDPAPSDDPKKQENALAYQLRKAKERELQLDADLKKYKQREEDERLAKLTAEQKRDEELITIREERDRLQREADITDVAIEAKLPKSMWSRIQGADKEAMLADALELAKLLKRPAAGTTTDPARDAGGKLPTYTRSQLQADPKLAASAEVRQALKEGRVING